MDNMKDITVFLIGGIVAVLFAPVIGWLLTLGGCFIMMVGEKLSQFPGIF